MKPIVVTGDLGLCQNEFKCFSFVDMLPFAIFGSLVWILVLYLLMYRFPKPKIIFGFIFGFLHYLWYSNTTIFSNFSDYKTNPERIPIYLLSVAIVMILFGIFYKRK